MVAKRAASAMAVLAAWLGQAEARRFAPVLEIPGGGDEALAADLAVEFANVAPGSQFPFVAVTSGAAQTGFLTNDCTFGGALNNCSWSPLGAGTPIDFAISAIPLSARQVANYEASPLGADGPPIQFPLYGLGVAFAVVNGGLVANGKLVVGDGQLCGILSGQITDWSQVSYTATPGPFTIVYDSNPGSGATWLLTQHLNAVCDATNSLFTQLPVPITGNFASLPVPGGVAQNAEFVGAAGSAGVAKVLGQQSSAIGYLAPNFTSLAPNSPATTPLIVAALYNSASGAAYLPTAANIQLALGHPGANASNVQPPASQSAAADPTRVPLLPTPGSGYPIVGYANWILSTCYVNNAAAIVSYLTAPYHSSKHKVAAAANLLIPLAAASPAYNTAVGNILLSNQAGYNLQIQNPVACNGRAALPGGKS